MADEDRVFPIQCSCGAVVRLRQWYMHQRYGRKDVPHVAPWEREVW